MAPVAGSGLVRGLLRTLGVACIGFLLGRNVHILRSNAPAACPPGFELTTHMGAAQLEPQHMARAALPPPPPRVCPTAPAAPATTIAPPAATVARAPGDGTGGPCGPRRAGRNIALVAAFNYKADPQRGKIMPASFDYIKTWYMSVMHHGLEGVVIGNMFAGNKTHQQLYGGVKYVDVDPKNDPILKQPGNNERSINDLVYYFALDWIEKNTNDDDYIILSDVHDVTFLQNPFPWMRSTDEVLGVDQVYGADEFRPRTNVYPPPRNTTRIERINWYWGFCFGTPMPNRWDYGYLYSSGIIGGRKHIMLDFVGAMIHYFGMTQRVSANCNMVVYARVVIEKYFENIFFGYPFHTKFMESGTEHDPFPGYIKHK